MSSFANEITNQMSENQEVTENVREYKINKLEKVKWIVDFNSNHVRYDSFPFATWSRIMRQKLLDEENYDTIKEWNMGIKKCDSKAFT